jgi:hypothetical protein
MKTIFAAAAICTIFAACSSGKIMPAEKLTEDTFRLTEVSTDSTYGFTEKNPVKVGGIKEREGPANERRYLNALLGRNGEKLGYYRTGSCCPFKTPNGMIDKTGMLDRYIVYYEGGTDTFNVYINMYDAGTLKALQGFGYKK